MLNLSLSFSLLANDKFLLVTKLTRVLDSYYLLWNEMKWKLSTLQKISKEIDNKSMIDVFGTYQQKFTNRLNLLSDVFLANFCEVSWPDDTSQKRRKDGSHMKIKRTGMNPIGRRLKRWSCLVLSKRWKE